MENVKKSTSKATPKEPKTKVLYVAAECKGFMTTGGLAEVAGSLPKGIMDTNKNYDVRVIMPLYKKIIDTYGEKLEYIGQKYINMPRDKQYCGVFKIVKDGVIYYFIDNRYYFYRDGSPYGHYDDGERFAFFSKAVLEVLDIIDFYPDIINANDWHTALVNIYLDVYYKKHQYYTNIKSVFTIHNIEYQGVYGKDFNYNVMDIGMDNLNLVEYNGNINLIKGAIVCSDLVTTVSPTYANEIKDPFYSCGLYHIINQYAFKLRGIVNGIDIVNYNPKTDNVVKPNYDINSTELKKEVKKNLQRKLGLEENPNVCIISVISRLASHKGIDLVIDRFHDIMRENVQFIVLGTGEQYYENKFRGFEWAYPGRVKACITFNTDLSKEIYAGSDCFLMPSKMEPCGLSQMIASRYGTVPIVRATGGLRDTIIDYGDQGNGFVFQEYNSYHMLDKIKQAAGLCNDYKDQWDVLVKRVMEKDFSWNASAKLYIAEYDKLLGKE